MAGVPGGQRRHRPGGVLGEQADDLVHVAARHRVHVVVDDGLEPLIAERAQGRLLARLGQLLLDRLARALERAVHRLHGRLERIGHLARGEPEHLAEDQRGALVRGQVLERGGERELDALAPLVAGLGRGEPVLEAELLVRVGLDPHGLRQRQAEPVGRLARRRLVERERPLRPPRDRVEARVRGDRVEPAAQRAATLEPAQRAPRAQQRLLQRVLRVLDGAEHPVAVRVQLAAIGRDQPAERRLVAAACRLQQRLLVRHRSGRHRPRVSIPARHLSVGQQRDGDALVAPEQHRARDGGGAEPVAQGVERRVE